MPDRDDYTDAITEAVNAAQSILEKALGEGCFDAPFGKNVYAAYEAKGLSLNQMRVAMFREMLTEAITESTTAISRGIDADEEAAWSDYQRNRPDRVHPAA